MEAKLIKIDRNGSKHYEGYVPCDRCGGTGTYVWGAIINGRPQYAGVCYKCAGQKQIWRTWIERTPEYQAKLDAKREAKNKAKREAFEKAQEELAKAQAEKEAKIKAEKAISQYVGEVGKRITVKASYVSTASFEVNRFGGYGTETMYVHTFKDADGNKLVWKTTTSLGTWLEDGTWQKHEYGENVDLTGTVKEHKEYREEKQTALNRCKLNWKGATV